MRGSRRGAHASACVPGHVSAGKRSCWLQFQRRQEVRRARYSAHEDPIEISGRLGVKGHAVELSGTVNAEQCQTKE